MPKTRITFVCSVCGAGQPKWGGQCEQCGAWNTLVETRLEPAGRRAEPSPGTRPEPVRLADVQSDSFTRLVLPFQEFNRVLGGGVVPGSVTLVGGDPGIGKSTLLLQTAVLASRAEQPFLYICGEESVHQVKLRAARMGLDSRSVFLLAQNNLEDLLAVTYQMRPQAVIVDSIQSVYLPEASSSAGGVTQVRECAARLTEMAKAHSISTFIVGHVTKSGEIAGPRVLEHIVDAVLYLEGERHHSYRILRSVKNRFGSTNEVGVFEMTARGMVEVLNPSEAFLAERLDSVPGSSVAVTIEGTRPLLVEIQALTSPCAAPAGPRRTANGVDFNRLLLLTAVLTKRLGLRLANQDVFVNVIGGLRISEPAADLGVASAIASAARGRAVAPDVAVFGEIGLSGELRSVNQVERRLHEAAKLGFKRAILPRSSSLSDLRVDGVELLPTRTLAEALKAALG